MDRARTEAGMKRGRAINRFRRAARVLIVASAAVVGIDATAEAAETRYQPAPDRDTRPCEHHPDMDLAAYAEAWKAVGPSRTLGQPTINLVPKDLTIENAPLQYVSIGTAHHAQILPLPEFGEQHGGDMVTRDFVVTSPCRVRDAAGKLWIVLRVGWAEFENLDYYEPGSLQLYKK